MAWYQDVNTTSGSVSDIYYTIRDTDGTQIKTITKFTNDTPGYNERHDDPNLTQLASGRVLLTWECHSDPTDLWDICYAVLDSAGNTIKSMTNASGTSDYSFNVDAVALSNGNSLIAWREWQGDLYRIAYAVLDTAYNRIAVPTVLSNPAAVTGDDYVSVAADGEGHAILTWMDSDSNHRHNLYYALVNSSGTQVTPPMIFRTSQATNPYIETSYTGYGNAGYSQAGALACRTYLPLTLRDYFINPYEDYDSWRTAYGPLVFGTQYQAYPDDGSDYYYFELNTTQSVTILLQNYQATGDLILYKHRTSDEPERVASWGQGGSRMTIGPRTLEARKYYVRVYTTADHNTTTLYTLTVTH